MKNSRFFQGLILAFVLLLPLWSIAQSDKTFIRQGNRDYVDGKYSEAEISYRKALDKNPINTKAQFNLGDAMYAQEDFEKAAEVFSKTNMEKTTAEQKSEVYYNYANAMLKAGKLNESIEGYKQALRHNPTNQEARYNLEYARQKSQEQQQNQDQQEQNKDDQQDQNKDQQDQEQQKDKKDQEKEQDQQDQNQDQQQNDQQNQGQQGEQNEQQSQKISKKDAERMLEALKNNEKKTLEKLKKEKKKNAKTIKSEKDW